MALTTFTAAQVLTAAQMNAVQGNDYNQTVSTKTASYTLVAADKGTRIVMNVASANTVTVNTSLFSAGDTLVIQNIGAGVTTVTAGTATVSSAGPLAIPQYGSGTLYFTSAGVAIYFPSAVTIPAVSSAFTYIGSGTLSGSSTTFSSVFSATYDNYLVTIDQYAGNAANPTVGLQIGGITSGVYEYGSYRGQPSSSANNFYNVWNGSTTGTSILIGNAYNYATTTYFATTTINILNPFRTFGTSVFGNTITGGNDAFDFWGRVQDTNSATSFTLLTSSASFSATPSNTVRFYGYANS